MDQFLQNVLNSGAFALIGVVMFIIAFVIIDLLTPGKLWDEIGVKKNTAAAILVQGITITLALIISRLI